MNQLFFIRDLLSTFDKLLAVFSYVQFKIYKELKKICFRCEFQALTVSTEVIEPRGEFCSITELPLIEYLSVELCRIQRRTARKRAMMAMKMTIKAETRLHKTVAEKFTDYSAKD